MPSFPVDQRFCYRDLVQLVRKQPMGCFTEKQHSEILCLDTLVLGETFDDAHHKEEERTLRKSTSKIFRIPILLTNCSSMLAYPYVASNGIPLTDSSHCRLGNVFVCGTVHIRQNFPYDQCRRFYLFGIRQHRMNAC